MARYLTGLDRAKTESEKRSDKTESHNLDSVDVKILSTLQREGRTSNVNLAKSAGVSPPPALRRTAALEERGIIKGYHADLDPKMLGYEVTSFITVALASQTQKEIETFEDAMQGYPFVRECHALSGHKDFLLRCVFHSLSDSNDFVRAVLLTTPNVITVNTTFAIARIKHAPAVPLDQIETRLSIGDLRKLRQLALRRAV